MINHNSIVPLYQQITEMILQDIAGGKFAEDNRLPTEEDMSTQYGVSRITVRRAINDLVEQGQVVKKQGKGTFVRAQPMRKDLKSLALSFSELCRANGKVASAKVLEAGIIEPTDTEVLEEMGLQRGERAVRILRLRFADDQPLVIEDNHFPMEYAYLLGADLEKDSIYRYLREEKGIAIETGKLLLRLIRAESKSAKLLQIPRNTPLLHMWGTTLCAGGGLLHTCRQIGYGENFDFRIR